MKTYLEFKDETSSKFWEIKVVANKQIITFGKIGTKGQTQEKEFNDSEEAEKEAKKLIESKIKKGYSVTSDNNSNEKKEETQPVLDIRETIFSKYKNLIPDFKKIPSLDLKKGAIKKYDRRKMHFGVIDFVNRIRLGGEYIALEVMQNKQIEDFPVVLYHEVTGFVATISSSIKNWFPCYLVYQIDTLLKIVWSPSGYNPQFVKNAKDSLEKIVTEKEAILTYLKPFGNNRFMEITDIIFKVISDLSVINNPLWDYIGFYRIADGNSSYIAEYHELLKDYFKNKTFDMDRLSKLINNNPQFNDPFSTYCIRDIVTLPMAKDFFHRKVFYSNLYYSYSDVIKKTKKELPNEDFPFKNIVSILSKNEYFSKSEEVSDEFYRVGEYFESKDDYQNAVNCFENSLYFNAISDNRPFQKKAFNKLIELSGKNNDLNYTSYLNYFIKRMNLDILEKVSFDKRFSKYIPDIEEIDGFDLNYNHSLDYCDINIFPNFAVKSLYSIGGTGHDHLVYCILPEIEPDNYPIAIYSEESGVSKVISLSIKTWFPSFLVYRLNELLSHYWFCAESKRLDSSGWAIESLDSILEHKDEILDICKSYDNNKFMDIINELFDIASKKDKSRWNYLEFYKIAENNSKMADFINMAENNTPKEQYKDFILSNPNYNYPLYMMFIKDRSEFTNQERVDSNKKDISYEIAFEIFRRRFSMDFKEEASEILMIAAKICYETIDKKSVYFPLIKKIAEFNGSYYDLSLADDFYELGNSLTKEKKYRDAAIAYENAIYLESCDNEEFHFKAFKKLASVSKKIKDREYEDYIKEYSSNVASDEDDDE